jgi:cytochrome c
MKTPRKLAALFLPFFILLMMCPFQKGFAQQTFVSPTPTHDPLAEPPLPEHPTEYELGRNLYWHWCMTCHGDVGQGLTDEFRSIWEEDHQNCWGRGCHAGHPGDMGFPIPTVVPALVSASHLAQFASIQELSDFLKATHPPQSPGILKDDEYHDIALFVFTMNQRPLIDFIPTISPTPASSPTSMPTEEVTTDHPSVGITGMIVFVLFLISVIFLFARRMFPGK